jgi:hypothetical protein
MDKADEQVFMRQADALRHEQARPVLCLIGGYTWRTVSNGMCRPVALEERMASRHQCE